MQVLPVKTQDSTLRLSQELCALLTDLSGEDIGAEQSAISFIDLGFDSLFLGQVSQSLSRQYSVQIGFRELLADLDTVEALAQHLDAQLPPEAAAPVEAPIEAAPVAPVSVPVQVASAIAPQTMISQPARAGVEAVVQAQLNAMQAVFAQQLQMVGQGQVLQAPAVAAQPVATQVEAPKPEPVQVVAAPIEKSKDKPTEFKLGRGASVSGGSFTQAQLAFARDLAERYSKKHAKSKAYTGQHRDVLADPRTAAGFRAEWKELTFPIVADRAKGAYIHDIDGNAFVDLVNGFGQTAFGHSPDFVTEAVTAQMARGYPIGPQSDLAGPVARKFAQAVGHERVTFCNTGSEAVMAAMRVARTVTGRDLIVVFDRDYHGQFDEVLVKGRAKGAPEAMPIAPGIPRSGLKNMVVLPYGGDVALDWITANIKDVAAVIVEPVQSRHPEYRPEAFVRQLREITPANGAALVIDEVVCGFRTAARGMQGVWGIQGDMATYGKVMGGGMPIGVLAGDAAFMDALDGGAWQFGDDSVPQAMPTFFAGTFVRHPLVLAAVDATLDHMAVHGDVLWTDTAARTARLAADLSAAMTSRGLPDLIATYSSWFMMNVTEADPRATLLYPLMRLEGVHVMDGFCAFLTTEHGEAECRKILTAFETALDTLLSVGILADLRTGANVTPRQVPVAAPAVPTSVPLTQSQHEIWMSYQLGGMAAAAFNESGTLYLTGALDTQALETAWEQVIGRHDALRLRFAPNGASFEVTDPAPLDIALHDLSGDADPKAALAALIAEDGALPFDLTVDRPIRLTLVTLAQDHHAFVITTHHLVADGWSFGVILDDFAALYGAAKTATPAHLPPAPSFAALAVEEAAKGVDPSVQAYWTAQHTPPAPLPDLPADRPRPGIRSYAGDTVFSEIDAPLIQALRKAGAAQKCTLFVTTFAAMQILVHRLSGAQDFAIGVPTAAQQNLPNPSLVGHCVNFLPIRCTIAEGARLGPQLQAARSTINAALDHQDTTFGSIVQALDLPRQLNRLPLTEIEFNLEQGGTIDPAGGLDLRFEANAKRAVNFDLFFNLVVTETGLRIEAHFNADLFDATRIQSWVQSYEAILEAIVADAEQPVGAVALLRRQDRDAVAHAMTAKAQPYDTSATLCDLVARTIATNPQAIAVSDGLGEVTYADLGQRSDALAALIQRNVPGVGQRVALCLPRGTEMLVGLLAILKAGHSYVPLDPMQPPARLRKIMQVAEVAALLVDSSETGAFASDLPLPQIVTTDASAGQEPTAIHISPEQAAYVIFTSGSTGEPKGVAVPHRAVVNFLTSMAKEPGCTAQDTILAVTTVMFDIAALELLLPLTVGGRVEIAQSADVIDGFKLAERLKAGGISVMQATPTLWDMVLTAGFTPPQDFRILCGGEALPRDLAQRLLAGGATLWNMYGPTETTIWSAVKQITLGAVITIGQPIANTALVILDEAGQPVPAGTTGELNIGGDGLALGYYNQPDLTAKAFRPVTLNGASRMLYATGDLARQLPDGEIEVLGRIDTQVKLRGFRIELGEIETRLRGIDGISAAAVDLRARGGSDQQLVGYVVADAAPDWDQINATLAADLPNYMIPRAWVALSALPQTANGKLDRRALPDPQVATNVTPLRQVAAPQTETERQIAQIWQEVLGWDEISVTDTLQALGVDSLTMFRIAAKQLDAGMNLEARHMFAHPSIRALAAFSDARGTSAAPAARPSLKAFRNGAQRRTIAGPAS